MPLALAALLIVRKVAPPDERREQGSLTTLLRDSDISASLRSRAGMLLLLMGLLNALPGYRWWLLGGAMVLAVLFVWRELRFHRPFLNLRFGQHRLEPGPVPVRRAGGQGVAAGIFQTCQYVGAISATVMIGIFYGTGVNQESWGRVVLVVLGLSAVTFVVSLLWQERETA